MDLQKALDNKLHPSETETGIFNPNSGTGIHLRDDGCVEIYAGAASLLIDGTSGVITLNGKVINHAAERILHNMNASGWQISTGSLNPKYFPTKSEVMSGGLDVFAEQSRSPLIARPGMLDFQIIAGVPQVGQTLIPLRTLVDALPLFRRASNPLTSVAGGVKKIIDELGDI